MPQSPSSNMLIVWPSDLSDADVWAPIMDTAIRTTVDGHDHSSGKGVRVPSNGLNINGDVTWSSGGSQWAITDLRAIDFSPQAASTVTSLAGALFLNSADNELYYRTFGGVNFKVTAGSALNVAAFTGGIGGDYAATGALVVFDDATDSYWFQQQVGASVRQYARMRSSDVDLYEFKANPAAGVPTNRVRLASPAALAASYAVTYPTALPSVQNVIQMTSAGQLVADNTIANDLALATNKSVTASGTGRFKHGTRTLVISTYDFVTSGGTRVLGGALTGNPLLTGYACGILLASGKRILAVRLFIQDSATGPTTYSFSVASVTSVGTATTIATSAASSGAGTNQTLQVTGLTTTVVAGTNYSIFITNIAGNGSSKLYGAEVDFDDP